MSSEGDKWATLPGRLVVISGPSGSGKSTLVRHLLARPDLRLKVSVSVTTRPPRPGEVADRDYVFLSPEEFERKHGDFLESAHVHDHYYGTPETPARLAMAEGFCVVLVIDVQGGFQVRQKVPDVLLVFVQPPSMEVLESRLFARGTDNTATIEGRLKNARREITLAAGYDVHVINDELEPAVERLATILKQNGCGIEQGATMIDELKEEEIVNKVGGRFKLSTLIQKRMIALNQGARALVEARGVDKMTVVIQEIMQEKIYLDLSGKLRTVEPTEELEGNGETVDLTQPGD